MPDFFVNRHGFRDLAAKNLASFREAVLNAAHTGNRKSLIFSLLAGFYALPGDHTRAIAEPPAFTFYVELERKAKRAAGVNENVSDTTPVWIPIDRAVELMRNEFRYARITDISRWGAEIEALLRLPDEIFEINKAVNAGVAVVAESKPTESPTSDTFSRSTRSDLIGSDLPRGVDMQVFESKPPDEQQRLMNRREEALVQNKVLRALARRGLNLRELFSMLDGDGNGEIDPDEFVGGIQELEGQLTDVQCKRLMEQIDTDQSGTVDFNELTRALQKLDLRVEISEYLLVCMRFFVAEMQRTASFLRNKFNTAAGEGKNTLAQDGVRTLIKRLDSSISNATASRLLQDMTRHESERSQTGVRSKRGSLSAAQFEAAAAAAGPQDIGLDTFIRIMMGNNFNAVSSPVFKDTALSSATGVLSAVNAFVKKLPDLASRKQSLAVG